MSGESEVAAGRCLLGVDLGGTRLRLLVERPDGDREPLVTTGVVEEVVELVVPAVVVSLTVTPFTTLVMRV